ncbi:hypothetical protein COY95_03790 [Candidatus Woesearchaeota archaeon CG_4_10_14_0_8_um_filter_47_5]|nr:MAG: hypothetical protein COY95_03790 [Candidatus Woesearchaeota archaeon CG_4_10_14_0_8_um_filter_47_5]
MLQFNPYQADNPARGAGFVGRETQLLQATTLATQSKDAAVLGYSRWGKTSLLQALVGSGGVIDGIDVIYLGYSGNSLDAFLHQLQDALTLSGPNTVQLANKSTASQTLHALSSGYQDSGKMLLVLMDETEQLFRDSSIVHQFRDYNQQLPAVSFLYAIFPHVFERMQESSSRFQDTVTMIPLTPFNLEQTRALVTLCQDSDAMRGLAQIPQRLMYLLTFDPFRVEEGLTQRVQEVTGGFPFLVQTYMKMLVDYAAEQGKEPLYLNNEIAAAMEVHFTDAIRPQISHLWNAFSSLQRTMILYVLKNPGITDEGLWKATESFHVKNDSVYLGALSPLTYTRGVGLVTDGNTFAIPGSAVRASLLRYTERMS